MADKISAMFVIEMLGKPADYLKDSLSQIVDKMGEEKGIKIIKKKVHEPKTIENSPLFTTFAEVEIEADGIDYLVAMVFLYMPSHVEVMKPETIGLKNCDANILLNEITSRLHRYDEIAKGIIFEKANLENQIKDLQQQIAEQNPVKRAVKKKVNKKNKSTKSKS